MKSLQLLFVNFHPLAEGCQYLNNQELFTLLASIGSVKGMLISYTLKARIFFRAKSSE
jgi:hypothetical protein